MSGGKVGRAVPSPPSPKPWTWHCERTMRSSTVYPALWDTAPYLGGVVARRDHKCICSHDDRFVTLAL